jgi:hypothetical protein
VVPQLLEASFSNCIKWSRADVGPNVSTMARPSSYPVMSDVRGSEHGESDGRSEQTSSRMLDVRGRVDLSPPERESRLMNGWVRLRYSELTSFAEWMTRIA